jgi:hypothetical protein
MAMHFYPYTIRPKKHIDHSLEELGKVEVDVGKVDVGKVDVGKVDVGKVDVGKVEEDSL